MTEKKIRLSRAGLAIGLSALEGFYRPKVSVEQYITDSEAAASVLFDAYMKGDIENKSIADLGSGTGILGIGALLLGAKKVYFVENDNDAMEIARRNALKAESESLIAGKAEFILGDIVEFDKRVDTVIMNPPFGTKREHSDREFLEKAFEISNVVYSFHKSETRKFVEAFARDKKFRITQVTDFSFPLKATMEFHRKRIERINVSCFRLVKESG